MGRANSMDILEVSMKVPLTLRLFPSRLSGFAVQPRQLRSGKVPGLTRLLRPNNLSQGGGVRAATHGESKLDGDFGGVDESVAEVPQCALRIFFRPEAAGEGWRFTRV